MSTVKLAENIILQAMEDLYDTSERESCVEFFTGEGFKECAALAGMDHDRMMGVLEAVSSLVSVSLRPGFREICLSGDQGLLHRGRGLRARGTG
jgi:hypothetical protein